ncbi:hypothetical protein AB5N19_09138 [Seiridium cardinale]
MANLPSKHPSLTLHLVDRSLTPLITSSGTEQQAQALASISRTALGAYETAHRLGLGNPQRIMLDHASNGPVLLHSFLNPAVEKSAVDQQNSANGHRSLAAVGGLSLHHELQPGSNAEASPQAAGEPDGTQEDDAHAPPLLLGTVIAPSSDSVLEVRRAAARLERVGKEVQTRWTEVRQQEGVPRA